MPTPTAAQDRGRRIASRRVACGLSQEELARLCQCSVRTIMRIERGANCTMTQRIRNALHERLGLTLQALSDGAGQR